MRINHNIAALNTYRQLVGNTTASGKSLEKLSSGLRINRAADDAAGLAISEKMRGQIRGLEQATRNSQDGISLIQTAEGALNETHSILQRMRELAVQASNDTNTTNDRSKLQAEVNQLAEEITRIGKTTEFNTQKLLNGTFSGTFHIGANQDQNLSLNIDNMQSYALGVTGEVTTTATGAYTAGAGTVPESIVNGTFDVQVNGATWDLVDSDGTVIANSADGLTFTGNDTETIVFDQKVTSGQVTIDTGGNSTGTSGFANTGLEAGEYSFDFAAGTVTDSNGKVVAVTSDSQNFTTADGATALFALDAAATADLDFKVGGTDISTADSANKAITTINNALESVSEQRSALGAVQNRLEHTVNNLGATQENLTASESRIRDVDMAQEMMAFTKNNILTQAAQAMLAQANQQPQGVLQLLR